MADSSSDDAAAVVAAEIARAEARRRRILEKSGQRLGIVSGEVTVADAASAPLVTAAATPSQDEPSSAANTSGDATETTAATTTGDEGDENAAASGTAGKPMSTAARMQAMRRRRFKKTDATTTPSEVTTPGTESSDTSTAAAATDESKSDTPPSGEVLDATTAAPIPQAATEPTTTPAPTTTPTTGEGDAMAPTASSEEEASKKYMGVAKMRRQMIKKKQQEEQMSSPRSGGAASSSTFSLSSSSAATLLAPPRKKVRLHQLLPIFMHWLTILLLFGAGFDVAWQQRVHFDRVLIKRDWGPGQEGIVAKLRDTFLPSDTTTGGLANAKIRRDFAQDDPLLLKKKPWKQPSSPGVAEFDDDNDDDEALYVPNIDPLFQVDLDQLTKGPGFFMQLARWAVAFHRFLLTVLFYLPQRIIRSLLLLPQTLWNTPPVLCIVAVVIRQVVAKMILGLNAPLDLDGTSGAAAGAGANASGGKANAAAPKKDLVALLQQTVMTFLANSFPTVVKLYQGWCHLRTDLYIILCGLFCGLAWIVPHYPPITTTATTTLESSTASRTSGEEL